MISGGYRCPLYDDDATATTTDLGSDQATHQVDSARGGTRTTPNAPPRPGLWSSLAACRSAGIVVAGRAIHGMRHSSDARHLLRELDAELLAVSNRTGRSLVWTPRTARSWS